MRPAGKYLSCALLAASATIALPAGRARAGELFDEGTLRFARQLKLRDWQRLAIHYGGRPQTLDSFARSRLGQFYGTSAIDGTSPVFAYLELYLNVGAYLERPVIRIPEQSLRSRLAGELDDEQARQLQRTRRLAPVYLLSFSHLELLVAAARAEPKHVDPRRVGALAPAAEKAQGELELRSALARALDRVDAFLALGAFRVIPAVGGRYVDPMTLLYPKLTGMTAGQAEEMRRKLVGLAQAWRARDAEQTNALLLELHESLIARAGEGYPSAWRRELEILHNRIFGFSIAWVGFAASAGLLLPVAARRRRGRSVLRAAGIAVFAMATAFLAAGWCIRWYLSGRGWHLPPLTNQYETVMGAALMAALGACVLEAIFRKGIFALAGSLVAAVALLAAFFQPVALGAEISAPAAILLTPILGWHVATLVIAYATIGMSLVVSLAYVGLSAFAPQARGALADLDRSNLVLVQLACWLVGVGVALGAYWGDKAWGRWWGWDPKETWGLMTFLVYVAIVHLRFVLPRRSRGLGTAILAIVGCAVMGFTWWGVSYLLRGLHSYA